MVRSHNRGSRTRASERQPAERNSAATVMLRTPAVTRRGRAADAEDLADFGDVEDDELDGGEYGMGGGDGLTGC